MMEGKERNWARARVVVDFGSVAFALEDSVMRLRFACRGCGLGDIFRWVGCLEREDETMLILIVIVV